MQRWVDDAKSSVQNHNTLLSERSGLVLQYLKAISCSDARLPTQASPLFFLPGEKWLAVLSLGGFKCISVFPHSPCAPEQLTWKVWCILLCQGPYRPLSHPGAALPLLCTHRRALTRFAAWSLLSWAVPKALAKVFQHYQWPWHVYWGLVCPEALTCCTGWLPHAEQRWWGLRDPVPTAPFWLSTGSGAAAVVALQPGCEKSQWPERWVLFCSNFLNHYFHFGMAPFACSHAPAWCSFRALFIKKQKKIIAKQTIYFLRYVEMKSDLWLWNTIGDYLGLTFARAVISGLFILTQGVAELTVKCRPYKMCNGLEMLFLYMLL